MQKVTVKQTDVYENLNGLYAFEVNFSDNPYIMSYSNKNMLEALKTWDIIDKRITRYFNNHTNQLNTSDLDFEYIKK